MQTQRRGKSATKVIALHDNNPPHKEPDPERDAILSRQIVVILKDMLVSFKQHQSPH